MALEPSVSVQPPRPPPVLLVRAVSGLIHWLGRARRAVSPAPLTLLEMTSLGFFVSKAILAAAKLGIPAVLEKGPRTSAEIAAAIEADELGVRRLLRALASVGLFEESKGRFGLNALSRQLLPGGPGSVAPILRLASEDWVDALWKHLPEAVRSGRPATERVLGMPLFEYLASHEAAGEVFDRAMLGMTAQTTAAVLEAYDLANVRTLVDLGGGLGQFLMAALERYPGLRGTLFELARTAEAAVGRIGESRYGGRIEIKVGSFLEDPLPVGADVYLLMNIIHDWGDADAVRILARVREALRVGARLLVVEMILPQDSGTPSMGSVLDLQMLLLFDGGRERTEAEFRSLYTEAGLRMRRILRTASPSCIMELTPA